MRMPIIYTLIVLKTLLQGVSIRSYNKKGFQLRTYLNPELPVAMTVPGI
jgi:hypothetical protein